MAFSFKFSSESSTVPKIKYESNNLKYYMSGTDINLTETPSTLVCDSERPLSNHKPISVSFKSNTKRLEWSKNTYIGNASDGFWDPEHGACNLTFKWSAKGQWKGSQNMKDHPNQLGITFNFDNTFGVEVNAEGASFWNSLLGKVDSVPSEYSSLKPPAPTIDLKLKPLDYFLTTNLLLPGEQVFIADSPVPENSGIQSGLMTPRDTILTGQIATSLAGKNMRIKALNAHRLLSGQAMVAEPSPPPTGLNGWKEALLSFPDNKILADMLLCYSKATDKTDAAIESVLASHNFKDLIDADFFALWGTSMDQLINPKSTTQAAPKLAEAAGIRSIDLRLFGAIYAVAQPKDAEGEQFMIHPTRGTIVFGRDEITPLQTFDTNTQKTVITWTRKSGYTYAASFSVVWDSQLEQLGVECAGTVHSRDGGTVPFQAFSKGYPSKGDNNPPTGNLLNLQQQQQQDPASSAGLWIGMIAGSLTILCFGVGCIKSWRGRRQQIRQDQAAYNSLIQFAAGLSARAAREKYGDHRGATEEAFQDLERRVETDIKDKIRELTHQDKNFWKKMENDANFKKDTMQALFDVASDRVKREVDRFASVPTGLMQEQLDGNPIYQGVTTEQKHDITIEFVQEELSNLENNLEKPGESGESYVESLSHTILEIQEIAEIEKSQETVLNESLKIDHDIAESEAETSKRQKESDHLQEEFNNEKNEEMREIRKKELDKANDRLNESKDKTENEVKKREEIKSEKTKLETEHKEKTEKKEKLEKNVKEAKKEVFQRKLVL
ncbi:2d174b5d-fd00-4191-816f-e42350dcf1be-CDS [Sclerotinia trifoliorum]|uniref:2d174b5d-fd00-4191-816f-e42350dcf1be-CDS n=1 Tax=Sclerotinia trifoliorum TaxID=28548 RepID=A0A8H2W138_9HELO|nr:2d174b5d-fd00-4191-816f-e42350dcf1be-CDS [Sclerotinia trifoliorum]